MFDPRPIRRFLGLRLADVSAAVGISTDRISLAERGLADLHPSEAAALENFLRTRLASVLEGTKHERQPAAFSSVRSGLPLLDTAVKP